MGTDVPRRDRKGLAWTATAAIAGCGCLLAAGMSVEPDARVDQLTYRARGAASARPACGFVGDAPTNRLPGSAAFPGGIWVPAGSGPELVPTISTDADVSPSGARDAARVDFDARGVPTPERWTCLEATADVTPGSPYTFSFSVRGPTGSFIAARGAAGAGFSRIPLNGSWQRVHLTEVSGNPRPLLRIGLAAHDRSEAPLPGSVSVLLWGPQLTEGRGIVAYQATGDRVAPAWPLELVPAGSIRPPCGPDDTGEPAATNLVRWSARMHRAPWSAAGLATVAWHHGPSPTGLQDAHGIGESKGPGPHRLTQEFDCPGRGPFVASIYLRPGARRACSLTLRLPGFQAEGRYDLDRMAATTESTPCVARIAPIGRGWVRLELTAEAQGPGTAEFELALLDRPDGSPGYEGDGRLGLLAWGPQVESGAAATSHIPTFYVPETREADEPVTDPVR